MKCKREDSRKGQLAGCLFLYPTWQKEHDALQKHLTHAEYTSARATVLDPFERLADRTACEVFEIAADSLFPRYAVLRTLYYF